MINKNSLKSVLEYQYDVQSFLRYHPTAKDATLKIEKRTNRHHSCDGSLWGWYEIYPLGIQVGTWGNINTLKESEIDSWNTEAAKYTLNKFKYHEQ